MRVRIQVSLRLMTLSVITLNIKCVHVTVNINYAERNNALHFAKCRAECRVLFIVMLSVVMLSVVMMGVVVPPLTPGKINRSA
jgi:hypothetical protein